MSKRKADGLETPDLSQFQTVKRPRTTAASTPRQTRQSLPQIAPVTPSDVDLLHNDAGMDDVDELAVPDVTGSTKKGRKTATPRKSQTGSTVTAPTPKGRQKSIHDTPSKSSTRRSAKTVLAPHAEDHVENDPAADLILKVAGNEDPSDIEEDGHSDIASPVRDAPGDNQVSVSLEGGFEAYFEQASRKIKTSNNTLSKLPELSQRDYLRIIKEYKVPYADNARDLYEAHVSAFPEWSFELDRNFSICLYGFGSKRSLVMDFIKQEIADYDEPYVVINGYHPNIDLRSICQSITNGLGKTGADVQSVIKALDLMPYERLILAIHNIDGSPLRNEKCIAGLCTIMSHEKIRTICTIDHINAPRLFSTHRLSQTSLIFHDATTFLDYTLETELQEDVLTSNSASGTGRKVTGDRGIKWILQTLSRNAQSIFKILVTEQLKSGDAVSSTAIYEKASAAFAVSNHNTYLAQLGEFIDHEMVIMERDGGGGQEMLRVPFGKEELERLLVEMDEEGGNED